MQHHKKLKDLCIEDFLTGGGHEHDDFNLLTVASIGNAAILEKLLKAKSDPDVGNLEGKTSLVGLPQSSTDSCFSWWNISFGLD